MAALRGATLIAKALDQPSAPSAIRRSSRSGSILCAYALDSALFAIHHVVCQTLVRLLGIAHAETNAAVLPRVMELMVPRAGKQMTALARALGTRRDGLAKRIVELGGGRRRLSALGADEDGIDDAINAIIARPELPDDPRSARRGRDPQADTQRLVRPRGSLAGKDRLRLDVRSRNASHARACTHVHGSGIPALGGAPQRRR